MNHVPPEMPPPVQDAIEKLMQAISEDAGLKGNMFNTLERYLGDTLWPSNFRELEKALDRLAPDIPKLSMAIRACLIPGIELFDFWREQLPDELAVFLKDLHEHYAYKYRVGAFRTALSGDGYMWHTVNVQGFRKNNAPCYGVSIVRNDGEQLYFEGREDSINRLIGVIQGVMGKKEEMKSGEI